MLFLFFQLLLPLHFLPFGEVQNCQAADFRYQIRQPGTQSPSITVIRSGEGAVVYSLKLYRQVRNFARGSRLLSCDSIKVRGVVVPGANGAKGEIRFEFAEPRNRFNLHVLENAGVRTLRPDEESLTGLSPGKYRVIVTGSSEQTNYCPRLIEFTVN